MDEWFYEESGKQGGPVSGEKIKQLLATRTLDPSSLVWRDGMPQWSRVDTIPGFETSPYASPAAGMSSEIDWSGYSPTGPQIRPWVRYWARTLDILLFSLIGGLALGAVFPAAEQINDLVFGLILMLIYNFVEPLFLSVWGATPFKALFLIRVRNQDGSKLAYRQALVRTFKVWLRGEALGAPLISIFTHLTAYTFLTERKITSWDAEGGFIVSHREIAWWRWIVVIALVALPFVAIAWVAANLPE
ncbi:RDD family protein [Luteolibacter yonseiensis]|uniref:RDD family protein n=1 Tax=Luteolibacter yonseiensis TaxID=1144680 RepID=A0A934QWN5_9BACT|nr:RDD family protein [Luteolibacter yonseiensis]MBK1814098.1 RDD family protein [Luteolibacter yonseiensis]